MAAVASVAVWWRERGSPSWEWVDRTGGMRAHAINVGTRAARRVHVRAGSIGDSADVDEEARAVRVAPGEIVPLRAEPSFVSPDDYGIVITWRGRFGRTKYWRRHLT